MVGVFYQFSRGGSSRKTAAIDHGRKISQSLNTTFNNNADRLLVLSSKAKLTTEGQTGIMRLECLSLGGTLLAIDYPVD